MCHSGVYLYGLPGGYPRVTRAVSLVSPERLPMCHPYVIRWSPGRLALCHPSGYPCVTHVSFGGHPVTYVVTRMGTLMVFRAVTLVVTHVAHGGHPSDYPCRQA
jgi:hypothetical protein